MKIYIKASIATSDLESIKKNLFLYYGVLKNESNKFFNAYDAVLDKEDEIDDVSLVDRGKLYNKYFKFADKCQEIADYFNEALAGRMSDYILIEEMHDLAQEVANNFPYDWEKFGEYAKMTA